jgi:hypothetical protein
MREYEEYIFKIGAYSPETFPMERLAEYMHDIARLYGEQTSVHFRGLENGSTKLVAAVKREAVPRVEARIASIRDGTAPEEILRLNIEVNKKLANDNTDGFVYRRESGETVIEFPGVRRVVEETFGPVTQQGAIDGVVRRVGGRGALAPVMLETADGYATHCYATRETAKDLAQHFDGPVVRCFGRGTWVRDEIGQWSLSRFTISNFEVLDQRSLPEVLAAIQAGPTPAWREADNVWGELESIRDDDEAE